MKIWSLLFEKKKKRKGMDSWKAFKYGFRGINQKHKCTRLF